MEKKRTIKKTAWGQLLTTNFAGQRSPPCPIAVFADAEFADAEFGDAEFTDSGFATGAPGGSTTTVTRSAPLLMYLNKYLIEPTWLHHSTLM